MTSDAVPAPAIEIYLDLALWGNQRAAMNFVRDGCTTRRQPPRWSSEQTGLVLVA